LGEIQHSVLVVDRRLMEPATRSAAHPSLIN
jgi:hypothetical protein